MENALFLLGLALLSLLLFAWGFRVLPRENWQILAALPRTRDESGQWRGMNLTWYGVLSANAYLAATALALVLLGSIGVSLGAVLAVALALLALCVPASRLVAWMVEKKAHTFTVGGAVFVGIVAAPWIVLAVDRWGGARLVGGIPALAALAAFSAAYALGEGLGRLACISFGCCYGKPLSACHPRLRRLLGGWHFAFSGPLKKIAYADNLEGARVVPVQGMTAVLYVGTGLLSTHLFLQGHFGAAFLLAILVTQGWRVLSEVLRADHRGGGRLSAYQVMGLLAIPYTLGIVLLLPGEQATVPRVLDGIAHLWHPGTLLMLQGIWGGIFLFTGRSSVTGSTLAFHVHRDRI